MEKIKIPALLCKQNGKEFYLSIIESNILSKACFVSRRNEDAKEGFQRNLNEARAKSISKYLDEQKGIIPSALILSAQTNSKFKYDKNSIEFELNSKSLMVIDGQHRMYGLITSKNNYSMPVVIFNGLKPEDEVNLFIDINTNQKGVPTSLLLDIKQLTGYETDKEQIKRIMFDKLNKESVLAGYMSPSKSVVGKISRITFNSAIENVINNGFFKEKDIDTIFKGVKNYLSAAEKTFIKSKSQKAKLTNSIFFNAIFKIFNHVIDKSLNNFGDLKIESLESVLEPVSKLNYDNYIGTSNTTLNKVYSDMLTELNDYDKKYRDLEKDLLF